ncbi:OmpH family outer membrane protein [Arachidicoccus soli]|uniref:OmpH family outer membrane protein n=1 Tax=Arachidicoccus soli TaxID=2341117 RepID=A0A386HMD7_9BACT|nr:OmpH family outer membrane protein [Arachidicoccus soli]AYD46514.1 OmpH family outer membrane protein [Arachidicoccus soli]
MKRSIYILLLLASFGIVNTQLSAQTATKIGYFDVERMASFLPEAKTVQSKMDSYQRDSLSNQKNQLDTLFNNSRDSYTADSLAKKSKSILDYDRKKLQELYIQEMGWQQYAQEAAQNKYYELMQPLLKKTQAALGKAATENHIAIVVKSNSIQWIDEKQIMNMFIPVAKILNVTLPQEQK